MRDRPSLDDAAIAATLRRAYGIEVARLDFLQLGYDAAARVFCVHAAEATYFLKVRLGEPNRAGLIAPRFLAQSGILNAVAPIATIDGDSFASVGDHSLILFPWIDGGSAWGKRLSPRQWREWGDIMRRVHGSAISPELMRNLPTESFGQKWLARFDRVVNALDRSAGASRYAKLTAEKWREHASEIIEIRRRYISLGEQFAARKPDLVMCHADIHQANILLDAAGAIHIVDWDEAILAPKERDLMFFVEDGHCAESVARFFAGYGGDGYDRVGLAYYKYDWVMQELCDFGERLLLPSAASDSQLAYDYAEFRRLFLPGDVIERARIAYAAIES